MNAMTTDELHHAASTQPDCTTGPDRARRDALGRILKAGGALSLASMLTPTLAGCQTPSRVSRVGEPIGADPRVRPIQRTPSPSPRGTYRGATSAANNAIDRRDWARYGPNPSRADRMNGIRRITIHHDGMDAFTSTSGDAAARRLESVRRAHVGRGWADIGYHFAIDPAGRVWEGRPIDLQGAHVKHHNEHNLGVMVMGNYELQRPTDGTVRSLEGFVAGWLHDLGLGPGDVRTHRELAATACPGRFLQRRVDVSRSPGGAIATA